MTTRDAAKLRAKREAELEAARRGATFRAWDAARRGVRLVGNYYELPVAEQLEWREKERKADAALKAGGL